jgi:hypothetical protein
VLRFAPVRVLRAFATTGAIIALVFACFGIGGDPQRTNFNGDEGDTEVMSSPALSESRPVSLVEPPVVPPKRGTAFADASAPPTFLTTAEVFRPPRVAA